MGNSRWTIEELKEKSDVEMLRGLVGERDSDLSNYSPLSKRLHDLRDFLGEGKTKVRWEDGKMMVSVTYELPFVDGVLKNYACLCNFVRALKANIFDSQHSGNEVLVERDAITAARKAFSNKSYVFEREAFVCWLYRYVKSLNLSGRQIMSAAKLLRALGAGKQADRLESDAVRKRLAA